VALSYLTPGIYIQEIPSGNPPIEALSNRPPLVLLTAVAALTNRQEKAKVAATEVLRVQPDFTISGWLKFIRLTNQEYADRLTQGLRMAGLPE
jgi:hypothetical protein